MRVLILTQYFTPEVTAAPQRLHPFAEGLARRGAEVRVVAEIPSHPTGLVHPGYGGKLVERRHLDGFEVEYVWARPIRSKGARARAAAYASYAAAAALAGSLARRPDVVLASSPPLTVGAVGEAVARRHRVPWVFDVRDLWPEVAVALNEVSNPRVIAAARRLERRLYRGASAITTPTEPFRRHIAGIAGDQEKVHVVANGTTDEWLAAGRSSPARDELGLPSDTFVWTYCGNLGLSQDLDTAIGAAALLGDGFELAIVGDGASRPRLEREAATSGANVRFVGLVPPALAGRYMAASDALLVPLADVAELGKSIPIKLYDSAAIGKPLVVAAPGEPRRIAEQGGFAALAAPGDPAGLAAAVRSLRDDPERAARLGEAARAFAKAHLREAGVDHLHAILAQAAGR